MDKKNLYYIIKKGTNQRASCVDGVVIAEKGAADSLIRDKRLGVMFTEKISVFDYEKKFR